MTDTSEEPRPRKSRFDQTEPPPSSRSRFDRRSRSPAPRKEASETGRSRSPVQDRRDGLRSPSGGVKDPAKAAAEAAARINAQLQAKKAIQTVDVPPVRTATTPTAKSQTPVPSEVYTQDGDFIKDIEVNDLRNRYTLTKGATQKMIKDKTGADITTRGEYYPDKSMATPSAPPLYLHITSQTKDGLEKAVGLINDMMTQELPNLVDERRFRRREPEQYERDEFGRRKWPEERIPIDLEPIPGFNLRAQVVGAGGAYVKYIQGRTKCRVQIKGRGSGFTEHATNAESDEPMYLHVAGPDAAMVDQAKQDCIDLLANVKKQYEEFKRHGPSYGRQNSGSNDFGGHQGQQGPRIDRNGSGSYGGGGYAGSTSGYDQNSAYGAPTAASPVAGAAGATDDYAAQWAKYYAENPQAAQQAAQDPYAQYGGYEAYQAMYAQYYAAQQGSPAAGANAYAAPGGYATASDPAPPAEAAPPPPPGAAPGGYNAVPPPPGM